MKVLEQTRKVDNANEDIAICKEGNDDAGELIRMRLCTMKLMQKHCLMMKCCTLRVGLSYNKDGDIVSMDHCIEEIGGREEVLEQVEG
jgi:hypothetical protein